MREPPRILQTWEHKRAHGEIHHAVTWDELFFDLSLVAAIASASTSLDFWQHHGKDDHHGDSDDHGHGDSDDHGHDDGHHGRFLSGAAAGASMPIGASVAHFCLVTGMITSCFIKATVQNATVKAKDLTMVLSLFLRACCVLAIGAEAGQGGDRLHAVFAFFAFYCLVTVVQSLVMLKFTNAANALNSAIAAGASAAVAAGFAFALKGGWEMTAGGYVAWALCTPFFFMGHVVVDILRTVLRRGQPDGRVMVPLNVAFVCERDGLLVIVTCGEAINAASAVLARASGRGATLTVTAFAAMLCGLLLKLMYFELQGNIGEHALRASWPRGIAFGLLHLPLWTGVAGVGAALHLASGDRGNDWRSRERRLFCGFLAATLVVLAAIQATHGARGRAHRRIRREVRIAVRLASAAVVAALAWLPDDVHAMDIVLVAAIVMLFDFLFEFYGRRPPSMDPAAPDVELSRPSAKSDAEAPRTSAASESAPGGGVV